MLNDPAIDWRSSCARFVIFWLDNIPYACDLYNPSRPYFAYTSTDPGRDAIAGTHLRTNGIKTIIIWWQYWMGDTLADGIAVIRGSTTLTIYTLRPRVRESAYTSWVSFATPYYTGITTLL